MRCDSRISVERHLITVLCNFTLEAMCGAGDALGMCSMIAEGCLDFWDPVCGCDGMTYSNTCYAAREGVSVRAEGECPLVPVE